MSSTEEIMVALRDCWCAQLGDTVATCCITAGAPVIADCCSGFSWVRLVGAYPSVAFPQQFATSDRCRIDTWAIQVELGVSRCAPQPCTITGPPCCASELTGALAQWDDFARARRVFFCCLPASLRPDEIIPGPWRVVGPEGECITSTMTATLFVSDDCDC